MEDSKNSVKEPKTGRHSPSAIANYFIKKGIQENKPLTAMQVLKLVYIAHGFSLGLRDEGLASEPVEAWKYGTVFSSLYRDLKKHGKDKIKELLCEASYNSESKGVVYIEIESSFNETDESIMNAVYTKYAHYDGWTLSGFTHQTGTPWYEVWQETNEKEPQRSIIPDSKIQSYFKKEILNKQQ